MANASCYYLWQKQSPQLEPLHKKIWSASGCICLAFGGLTVACVDKTSLDLVSSGTGDSEATVARA